MSNVPKIVGGDIANWPILKIVYRSDAEKIAALLPPGIEPGAEPNVHLSIYNVPVPDEPEYGVMYGVDASYRGTEGRYAIGYGIDQESAVFISRDMNGQPKYPAETVYYRMGNQITARCIHQGYTFIEFEGEVTGDRTELPDYTVNEWWVKVSRAVGGAEKAYDFPPHVVHVESSYGTQARQDVTGKLTLRESPWDPFTEHLPQRELVEAYLDWSIWKTRDIRLAGKLDPEAYWPFVDTIGGSRWPGTRGGPRREG